MSLFMLLPAKRAASIQGRWCTNDSNLNRAERQTQIAQEEQQPKTSVAEAQRKKAQRKKS